MQNKKEQRDQMMAMIIDWQASGLKQRAYCAANKVAYHVFHYWYGVYRATKTETGSFIPVKICTAVCSKEQITIIGVNGLKAELSLTEQSLGFVKQLLLS